METQRRTKQPEETTFQLELAQIYLQVDFQTQREAQTLVHYSLCWLSQTNIMGEYTTKATKRKRIHAHPTQNSHRRVKEDTRPGRLPTHTRTMTCLYLI